MVATVSGTRQCPVNGACFKKTVHEMGKEKVLKTLIFTGACINTCATWTVYSIWRDENRSIACIPALFSAAIAFTAGCFLMTVGMAAHCATPTKKE